jgi:hypothetical protein
MGQAQIEWLDQSVNRQPSLGIRIIPEGVFTQCGRVPPAREKGSVQKAPSTKMAMLTAKAKIHTKLRSEARLTTYK